MVQGLEGLEFRMFVHLCFEQGVLKGLLVTGFLNRVPARVTVKGFRNRVPEPFLKRF